MTPASPRCQLLYKIFDSSHARRGVGSSAHDALLAPSADRAARPPQRRGVRPRRRSLAPRSPRCRRAAGAVRSDPAAAGSLAPPARFPASPERGHPRATPRSARQTSRAARIDLNRADVAELTQLPGIGPVLATRIVQAREADGPFAAVDDLHHVGGVSRRTIERLRRLVTVT